MQSDDIVALLDDPTRFAAWLELLSLQNRARAKTNLDSIARSGMTIDQVAAICEQLEMHLPTVSDPDLALNNFERFVRAARSPLAIGSLLERDPTGLPILLTIFSTSQYLSDLLIRDTESYDYLRLTEGQLYSRGILSDELIGEIDTTEEPMQAMQILRRFKHRETLRIAFGDLIVQHRIQQVMRQISFVGEVICQAALQFAMKQTVTQWGNPMTSEGIPCQFAIIALGKLGGGELNYSSDIDLVMVYQSDGKTDLKSKPNQVFFERLTRDFTKLLTESTSLGSAYRVDLRLRPDGSKGPICNSLKSFLQYYNLKGRTWERQALIKARPVAGDRQFGELVLARLAPWIYHRNLSRFDIEGIKALKRQIERRALVQGQQTTNVKTGHGGIRDIEFLIQFLQLLNGAIEPSVRTHNTLDAIRRLAQADCLTVKESQLLAQNYTWLRKLEHRLQVMFDLQTHTLPESDAEIEKTAKRMGYQQYFDQSALEQFKSDLRDVTDSNNRILNHLLHHAFGARVGAVASNSDASDSLDFSAGNLDFNAVDLVLDPQPDEEMVCKLLKQFRFKSPLGAYQNLMNLSQENSVFLSSRRCRHFLAAISTPLLQEIGQTPDPDVTLATLATVSDSIGAKGVLWELFSFNPPNLRLFVRLCASSDYLCSILCSNPGLVDELIDSLVLENLPTLNWLRAHLADLVAGAADLDPIIHSFKNVFHLRVGVRDIVGRDSIRDIHRALADIAQVCFEQVVQYEFNKSARKFANVADSPDEDLKLNSLVVLALGKLGGREPNYHSDLDVMFLYAAGTVAPWLTTSEQHFYSELAARVTKAISAPGKSGKLYDIDSRLRPTGKSGSLAVSFDEFERYFESGEGQLWERQALCKARPIFGGPKLRAKAESLVRAAILSRPWNKSMAGEIRDMRMKMQENCNPRNIKRGAGGTVDIEFAVEMLQIKYARQYPNVLVPGTLQAINQLLKHGIISAIVANELTSSYESLRSIEARFRLMNTTARHDLPEGMQLERLAYLLREDADELETKVNDVRRATRRLFDDLVSQHAS